MTKEQTKNLIQQIVVELGLIDLQKQKGILMKEIMSKYRGSIDSELVNQVLLESSEKSDFWTFFYVVDGGWTFCFCK